MPSSASRRRRSVRSRLPNWSGVAVAATSTSPSAMSSSCSTLTLVEALAGAGDRRRHGRTVIDASSSASASRGASSSVSARSIVREAPLRVPRAVLGDRRLGERDRRLERRRRTPPRTHRGRPGHRGDRQDPLEVGDDRRTGGDRSTGRDDALRPLDQPGRLHVSIVRTGVPQSSPSQGLCAGRTCRRRDRALAEIARSRQGQTRPLCSASRSAGARSTSGSRLGDAASARGGVGPHPDGSIQVVGM